MAANETPGPEGLIEGDPQESDGPPIPPKGSNPQDIARWVMTSHNAYATTLLVMFVDAYGMDALEWHPTAIRMQLEQDHGVELLPANLDRLMAAITLVTTNYFHKNLPKFMDLCHAINGHGFDPTQVVPPDSAEMAWAISESLLISPPESYGKNEPFCEDILHFVGAVLREEGYVKPPDVLRIASDANLSAQVKDTFAGDPDMFKAIYDSQTAKTEEINELIKRGMAELLTQIDTLHLTSGSAEKLTERLRKDIYADEARQDS
jgi:hypothetical protein